MQNSSTVCVVDLGLWRDYAQTKHNRHRPRCGDGAYSLGLGVLTPHTMVGGQSRSTPWLRRKTKIIYSRTGFLDLI